MPWAAVVVAVVVLAIGLGLVAHRTRRRATVLETRLAATAHELESLQRAFSRFAPAEVVDQIALGHSTQPQKKNVTVLFADLEGFTILAETLDPAVLVKILNDYFERMSRAISAHRGHVAKFMGDGILALFGALETNPWQTNDAVHAALAMRAALAALNRALAGDGVPALGMGVGIHRGAVVAGVLGSAELMEYGVIGSTVNLAARIERLTRVHGVDILVTEAARATLDRRFRLRSMPSAEVKGISLPLVTFAVDGFEDGTPGSGLGNETPLG